MYDLNVKRLCAKRKNFELKVSRLFIRYGEKIAVMGENGSGKSTLLLSLCGLLPFEGTIFWGERSLSEISFKERAKVLSYLPQNPDILFPYTVEEIVFLGLNLSNLSFVNKLFDLFELEPLRSSKITELSGGERKRVFVARVMAQDTPVVFLDEPTASLDIRHRIKFLDYIRELDKTILCVMHDINEALRYFDRFLFMKRGHLLYDLKREEVSEEILSNVFDVSVSSCKCFIFSSLC